MDKLATLEEDLKGTRLMWVRNSALGEAEPMRRLADGLRGNTTLTDLTLLIIILGEEGAVELGKALGDSSTLKKLKISNAGGQVTEEDGSVGDVGALALANGLRENASVESAIFEGIFMGPNGIAAFGETLAVNTTLTSLTLHEEIDFDAARAIAKGVEANNTLKKLDLGVSSNLTAAEHEELVRVFIAALKCNTSLEELDLGSQFSEVSTALQEELAARLSGADGVLAVADQDGETPATSHVVAQDSPLWIVTGKVFPSVRDHPDFPLKEVVDDPTAPKRTFVQSVEFDLRAPAGTDPHVAVFLSAMDVVASPCSCRIAAKALNCTEAGFDLELSVWGECCCWGAEVNFVAFSSGTVDMVAGQENYGTFDDEQDGMFVPASGGQGGSRSDTKILETIPVDMNGDIEGLAVFAGFCGLEIAAGTDRRVAVEAELTDARWSMSVKTWSDTKLLGVEVSWIAFSSTLQGANCPPHLPRIQIGRTPFHKRDADYTLMEGHGGREAARVEPLEAAGQQTLPQVVLALGAIDVVDGGDSRVRVSASDASADKFKCTLSTWSNTRVWATTANWLVITPPR
jgi:H-type lectin domain